MHFLEEKWKDKTQRKKMLGLFAFKKKKEIFYFVLLKKANAETSGT